MNLSNVRKGKKAKIIDISNQGGVTRRMVEMGVTRGSIVEVTGIAPLGDPIDIKVKGYQLSLRKEGARSITVEPI